MLCSDLLWDAQSVSRKQVPTLQDAFLCCDRETLLSMVEQGYARQLGKAGIERARASTFFELIKETIRPRQQVMLKQLAHCGFAAVVRNRAERRHHKHQPELVFRFLFRKRHVYAACAHPFAKLKRLNAENHVFRIKVHRPPCRRRQLGRADKQAIVFKMDFVQAIVFGGFRHGFKAGLRFGLTKRPCLRSFLA